jgi:hypothetical protein
MIKIIDNQNTEKVNWNSPNDNVPIDFVVGKQGLIYLNAKINDVNGLFLFDTGCELTSVNEKIVCDKKKKLNPYTILDAKGITQTKNVFKVKSFELGAIEIRKLHVYPTDSITWTHPKGSNYNQDSILGTIGNNIISKFIWDFDLINQRVTVSNNKMYCLNLLDSAAIDLVTKGNHKEIEVLINGEQKILTLDFGCSFPIVLSDSIPEKKVTEENFVFCHETKGALDHLDSTEISKNSFDFADIKLGTYEYTQIKCVENDHADLLGIPFIWSFKRVVLDFNNCKSYFISENEFAGGFGVNNYNRQSTNDEMDENGVIWAGKPGGMTVVIERDSIRIKYIIYGSSKFYKNNYNLLCNDSLLMPNGEIQHGPFTLNFKQ